MIRRDTPVKSEPGLQAQEHNSSLPAVDPQVVRPKKGKAKGKRDKQSTGVATDHKQPGNTGNEETQAASKHKHPVSTGNW